MMKKFPETWQLNALTLNILSATPRSKQNSIMTRVTRVWHVHGNLQPNIQCDFHFNSVFQSILKIYLYKKKKLMY